VHGEGGLLIKLEKKRRRKIKERDAAGQGRGTTGWGRDLLREKMVSVMGKRLDW